MPYCAVAGCQNSNKNTTGISFFTFPKDLSLANIWLNKCKRDDKVKLKNATICSVHFEPTCFQKTKQQEMLNYSPKRRRKIKPDAIPTLLINKGVVSTQKQKSIEKRQDRLDRRARKSLIRDLLQKSPGPSTVTSIIEPVSENLQSTAVEILDVKSSQDEVILEMRRQIDHLLAENKEKQSVIEKFQAEKDSLQTENANLLKDKVKLEAMIASLKTFFTKGQLEMILQNKKKIKWNSEDIAAAISLRNVSPKAYRYLKIKLNYPLPDVRTLRRWASTLNTDEGLLIDVITLMKAKAKDMSAMDRVIILTYDEMYVSDKICFDPVKEQIIGPCKSVQVIMARSLFGNWKQPVYYKFDQSIKTEILNEVINSLEHAGFYVISLISDMGGSNLNIWKDLTISQQKPFFSSPYDSTKNIYIMADHFIDHGFVLANGKSVTKNCIEELLKLQLPSDLKLAYKINHLHLSVTGSQRQKVKLATQLFSNTTANAIEWCGEHNMLQSENWKETAEFIKIVNNWFDVCNSSAKYGKYEGINGYGVNLDQQNETLRKMSETVSGMRQITTIRGITKTEQAMLPFQRGILVTNAELKMLYEDISKKLEIKYIITRRANQDVLENFFSYLRAMGANEYPSPYDVKHRLKWYILGKHSEAVFSMNKNTEDPMCGVTLTNPSLTKPEYATTSTSHGSSETEIEHHSKCSTGILLNNLVGEDPAEETIDFEGFLEEAVESMPEDVINDEGLRYVTGYVAYRYINKFPDLQLGTKTTELPTTDYNWIYKISRGFLINPSESLMEVAHKMKCNFIQLHGNFFNKDKLIISKIVDSLKLEFKTFPEEILRCLVRTRTYIRIRLFTLNLQSVSKAEKAKIVKKMRKTTNN